eukprot:scaffold95107_cov19-Tisochrysis_lutea.AAC.2
MMHTCTTEHSAHGRHGLQGEIQTFHSWMTVHTRKGFAYPAAHLPRTAADRFLAEFAHPDAQLLSRAEVGGGKGTEICHNVACIGPKTHHTNCRKKQGSMALQE